MKYKEVNKLFREHPWLRKEFCEAVMKTWPGRNPFTQDEINEFAKKNVKGICFQDWSKIRTLDINAQHEKSNLVTPGGFVLRAYVSMSLSIYYHLASEETHTRVWRSQPHDSGKKKTAHEAISWLQKQDKMDAGLVFDALVVNTFAYADSHHHTYTSIYPFPEQKPQHGLTCEEFERLRAIEGKSLFSEPEIKNFASLAINEVSQRFRVKCAPYQLKPAGALEKWVAKRPREEWENIYLEAIQRVVKKHEELDEILLFLNQLFNK